MAPHAAIAVALGVDRGILAVPWFVPGVIVAVLVGALVRGRVARSLSTSRPVAWLLVAAAGTIAAATLTPLHGSLEPGAAGAACNMSRLWLAPPSVYLRFGDPTLNVLLFVPLGVALAALPRGRPRAVLIGIAFVLPLAIELTQLLGPVLGRACESGDVVDNISGLVCGLTGSALVRRSGMIARRADAAGPERS